MQWFNLYQSIVRFSSWSVASNRYEHKSFLWHWILGKSTKCASPRLHMLLRYIVWMIAGSLSGAKRYSHCCDWHFVLCYAFRHLPIMVHSWTLTIQTTVALAQAPLTPVHQSVHRMQHLANIQVIYYKGFTHTSKKFTRNDSNKAETKGCLMFWGL